MKVAEITATDSAVFIRLEPENAAETALVQLLHGCEARCDSSGGTTGTVDTSPSQKLTVNIGVKKSPNGRVYPRES